MCRSVAPRFKPSPKSAAVATGTAFMFHNRTRIPIHTRIRIQTPTRIRIPTRACIRKRSVGAPRAKALGGSAGAEPPGSEKKRSLT